MKKEKAGVIDVESQSIAYSLDEGETWIKYQSNPVLKNPGVRDFRDPKIIWHEQRIGTPTANSIIWQKQRIYGQYT